MDTILEQLREELRIKTKIIAEIKSASAAGVARRERALATARRALGHVGPLHRLRLVARVVQILEG